MDLAKEVWNLAKGVTNLQQTLTDFRWTFNGLQRIFNGLRQTWWTFDGLQQIFNGLRQTSTDFWWTSTDFQQTSTDLRGKSYRWRGKSYWREREILNGGDIHTGPRFTPQHDQAITPRQTLYNNISVQIQGQVWGLNSRDSPENPPETMFMFVFVCPMCIFCIVSLWWGPAVSSRVPSPVHTIIPCIFVFLFLTLF